jgi:hypothetical protein
MLTSDSIKELATALAKAQGELMGAKKDTANPFFKSKYADLASIVEALKACFPKYGLAYVQTICTSEDGVGVETILMHASGEWVKGDPFYLPVNKADAQGFGSCATYARRYSLAAISGVAPEDDDGNAAASAAPKAGSNAVIGRIKAAKVSPTEEAKDAFESLPEEAKIMVREWAMEAIALVKQGKATDAFVFVEEKCQTTEDKLAIWSQLPSETRTAITTERNRLAIQAAHEASKGALKKTASRPTPGELSTQA